MYYYCKNSRKKILHSIACFHARHSHVDTIGWFEALPEAYAQGYRLCKHCNPLVKHYKREDKELVDFCCKNGLAVYLRNRCISISSVRSKWKIALNKNNQMVLYHKNGFSTSKDHLSEIDGYHLQGDVQKTNIVDYLQYIVNHDGYRMRNPIYIPKTKKEIPPPRKGTRRYKNAQRRKEAYEHKRAIRNVLNLIESLNIPASSATAMSV